MSLCLLIKYNIHFILVRSEGENLMKNEDDQPFSHVIFVAF